MFLPSICVVSNEVEVVFVVTVVVVEVVAVNEDGLGRSFVLLFKSTTQKNPLKYFTNSNTGRENWGIKGSPKASLKNP